MADLIQAPFLRNEYNPIATYKNPVWIGDIVAINQALITMLQMFGGFDPTTDFALLFGFAYTPGSPGTYGPGLFYLNGSFYYQSTTFNEGLRLIPDVTGTMPYSYIDDSVTRDTYNVNYSQTGTGASQTPVFAVGGDMGVCRMDNKTLNSNVQPTIVKTTNITHLGSGHQVTFTRDENIFFGDAVSNATITFDLTNARPGVVITLKWTFSGSETLTITAPGGTTLIRESGQLALAANNTNILNIMYATDTNDLAQPEIRYTFNQAL